MGKKRADQFLFSKEHIVKQDRVARLSCLSSGAHGHGKPCMIIFMTCNMLQFYCFVVNAPPIHGP